MDFYSLEPDQIMALDVQAMKAEELRDLAYFIWCFYPYEEALMDWRKEKLLPLVAHLPTIYDDDVELSSDGE